MLTETSCHSFDNIGVVYSRGAICGERRGGLLYHSQDLQGQGRTSLLYAYGGANIAYILAVLCCPRLVSRTVRIYTYNTQKEVMAGSAYMLRHPAIEGIHITS